MVAMQVLITGATGFVGSHAARAARAAGHEVRVLVRNPDKLAAVLGPDIVNPDHVVVGDMADAAAVASALEGCDSCIHAAAAVGVSSAAHGVDKNIDGTRAVLGQAVAAGCDPIIYTSTVGIFVPSPEPVITSSSPLADPRSAYGRSKIGTEHYVRGLEDSGAPVVVFYPGAVTGPEQPVLDSNMEGIAESLRQGLPVCRSGGLSVLDVRDLADALVAALQPGLGPRRFMAGGHFFDWASYGELLASVSGHDLRRFPISARGLRAVGATLDGLRRIRPIDWPINRESTAFMTTMTATDDSALRHQLGIELRPATETIGDAISWLVEAGHLDARFAPALVGRA